MEDDNMPKLDKKRTKQIQQIIGALLWYCRNMDINILKVLESLTAQQNTLTEQTEKAVQQLLDYCITHPNAKI
eukprot:10460181-Ditylum_brightwellii.AAC.1